MTKKENEALTQSIYSKKRDGETLSAKDELTLKEIDCRDMIDSIICYGGFGKSADEILYDQETAYHNYLGRYVDSLGRDKVLKLIQEQLNDIVRIEYNTYTDCEGLSYNSIIYKDNI